MMTEIKGGLSREQKINLRTEAKVRGARGGAAAGRRCCSRRLRPFRGCTQSVRRPPLPSPQLQGPPACPPAARATSQAPFRFARTFIFGGLAGGAGLGLIVIIGRLIKSLQGGRAHCRQMRPMPWRLGGKQRRRPRRVPC